ncbi:cysteine desulfurase/selenocysteine lyase [Arthrobacter globiformis NBRC 12137]|uniref:Cysteine desulfurase n=1 Tax=Arthrobacter globiformis (strain ATCC 8010 / DSM 20124 / JCM 1332 / NBRC 12137 / NCIMB 8907 / NRRL B-2979 / 168) TaxID=1077972 RepID=H0QMF1_ARTG1|nr:SufS family cysteine desulfurase [Arthrobacter globiformis]GAB14002.1 cysteine desulfurase/selenocysteine lyase [Arthrobacter globiformis NBRC 12137]
MAVVSTPTTLTRALSAMDNAEVLRIRNDFPVLNQTVNGRPLIYLDSGATSQNPLSVIEAEQEFYEQRNAAVHRGAHHLAVEATEVFEDARQTVADFVGAAYEEIVWTSNATEGLNVISYALSNAALWAAQGRGDARLRDLALGPGDEIVVTEMEHHANLIPWQELAYRTGATLRHIPLDDAGVLRMDEAAEIVGERTRLLAFTHASNVLGTINPVSDLVTLARRAGALVVLDACQSAPHLALDVKQLDVDFAVFSGHKMLGPTGVGVLYGKQELLDVLPPVQTGGSMITTVTMERAEYLPAPQRFEAGTQKISQAVALAAAVNYLTETGIDRVHRWESGLGQRMVAGLEAIDGIRVLGPAAGQDRIGLAAFDVAGVHAHDVGQFLDARGIAVRVGHHCAQPLHRRLGLTATTRASAYLYNTTDDVDEFLDAVSGVRAYFRA